MDDTIPRHPTLPGHPAPLLARHLVHGEALWLAGPWKTLLAAARPSGWDIQGYVARGWSRDSRGSLGALTDSVSLRLRRRHCAAPADRAVALWTRPTWPTLGRSRGDTGGQPSGEGRATNEGKAWLWHPPMAPPAMEPCGKGAPKDPLHAAWKFDAAWIWSEGSPITSATSMQVRAWLKAVHPHIDTTNERSAA